MAGPQLIADPLGGRSHLTLFEYLAAGYVLMLSFAVLRAVSGLPYAVLSPARYWVHAFWLATSLGICFIAFWAFWSYREVEWTVFKFIGVLAMAALVYAYTSLLAPPDPSNIESWRSYYFKVRIPLFATSVVLQTSVVVNTSAALTISPLHPTLLLNVAHIALSVVGLASARPRVHAALPLAYSVLLAFYIVRLVEPGSLSPTQP